MNKITDIQVKINQFADGFDKAFPNLILVQAMNETRAEYVERIYGKGLDTDGQAIQGYSTTPYYASKESFVNKSGFKGRGKNGGKTKTMYLGQGYKQFREVQNRKTDRAYYKLSGDLEASNKVFKVGEAVVLAITDEKSSKKKRGLEKRSDNVFPMSLIEQSYLENKITELSKEYNA